MRILILIAGSLVLTAAFSGCSRKVTRNNAPQLDLPVETPINHRQVQPEKNVPRDLFRNYLTTLYFDYNDASLRPESERALERLAPHLARNNSIRLQAQGHCDDRGSSEYNMGLGEQRADAVRTWLLSYGITGDKIEITSFGKERPTRTDCDSESCHSENRRVEWIILSGDNDLASDFN